MIEIRVYADEVTFGLEQIPKRIRENLKSKFEGIFSTVKAEVFSGRPGKYLDPKFIQSGIEQIGSLQIGFIEAEDKPGTYVIVPTKRRLLEFIGTKDGALVRTKLVNHPYLKGAPVVARYLEEKKPWILDQLESAVIEAL
jgi:hypothetical protein